MCTGTETPRDPSPPTNRDEDILTLVAQGRTNQEIVDDLHSVSAPPSHIPSLMPSSTRETRGPCRIRRRGIMRP